MAKKNVILNRVLWVLFLGIQGWSSPALSYSYGPACQWIRLYGTVEVPGEPGFQNPVEISITYQLPGQERPAHLLTNYPVTTARFVFVLSGFQTEIEDVLFVSPGFYFSKPITFRYHAKSSDGRWQSGFHQSVFYPKKRQVDGKVLCQSAVHLDTLVLR